MVSSFLEEHEQNESISSRYPSAMTPFSRHNDDKDHIARNDKQSVYSFSEKLVDSVPVVDDWLNDVAHPPLRDPNILREQVLLQLRTIIDPDLQKDIVSLGFVKNLCVDYDAQRVSFTLELTTTCLVKDQFVADATRLLRELGWIDEVSIELTSNKSLIINDSKEISKNLLGVSSIIAVASCKGGVGKSTIACNMAYMLTKLGARVGLLDADIYGPSLPYIIPLPNQKIFFSSTEPDQFKRSTTSVDYEKSTDTPSISNVNKLEKDGETVTTPAHQTVMLNETVESSGGLLPLVYKGVKLMSYGYLNNNKYTAVRGPVISNILYQMITQTLWGDLDYLIIDLPPGTGDIHLTLAQSIPITCAVMITTPQQLSVYDVEKGIEMFNKLHIPTIAIVENMATFVCPTCNTTHNIFSRTNDLSCTTTSSHVSSVNTVHRLTQQFGISIESKIPLHPDFAVLRFREHIPKSCHNIERTEFIFPFVRAYDDTHPIWLALKILCQDVIREISTMKFSENRSPKLHLLDNQMIQMVLSHPHNTLDASKEQDSSKLSKETVLVAPSRYIRLNCRCAECVDEYTGRPKLNPRRVPANISIKSITQTGNYAVSIEWSDGHQSLLAFATLETIFRKYIETTQNGSLASSCGPLSSYQW